MSHGEDELKLRDFSWTYFSMTGDVDAYLLYKEIARSEMGEGEELADAGTNRTEAALHSTLSSS